MECKICLTRFKAHSSPSVSLPCDSTHIFHSDCLTHWFVSNRECPVCKQPSSSALMIPWIQPNQAPVENSFCILHIGPQPVEQLNYNRIKDSSEVRGTSPNCCYCCGSKEKLPGSKTFCCCFIL